jgi:GH24 family phage-related lysozyme (muramidase)
MENRFLEMDDCLRQISGKKGGRDNARSANGSGSYTNGVKGIASSLSFEWANALSAQGRVLVILIENGGVDLGISTLADKLLAAVPAARLIPDSYRQKLVDQIRETIKSFTDSLIESVELSVNRYAAAKPNLFGDVVVLRDGTSSYQDLKKTLISLSNDKKIIDLFILTHGLDNSISVPGGINGQKIRDMQVENGKPLSIRSVYMMNCVGSSLNQAWIDSGAKVSSGALRNNYLPEPTMFFFWQNWQEGQTFENAVTSAYRKTINLMNEAVRGLLGKLGIPGAASVNFENFDFVRDSAPVIQGQRSVTINSDDLTFSQSISSSLATTVLPVSLLRSLSVTQADADLQKVSRSVSQQGIDFIKGWEGFRATMYNDPVGHCTIGYGTLLHHGNCDGRSSEQPYINGVSEENATQLLAREVGGIQQTINNTVTVALNQNQNDALVSFVYNVGSNNFQKSTLLRLLNQGNYDAVPTEIKKWTKAHQDGKLVDLPGLVKRRSDEADLFAKGAMTTAKSLTAQAISPSAVEFWAVWCVNENCFLPEIFLQGSSAQVFAQNHSRDKSHRAIATAVRMGSDLNVQAVDAAIGLTPSAVAYGQEAIPETNIQVIRGPENFELPEYRSYSGNVTFSFTPPPPVGTQTQVGELSVLGSVVNESGTAVELLCSLIRRGNVERRSQVLVGNYNGDFQFTFSNVARSDTYTIILNLNTVDARIRVKGHYTVMIIDQR